MTRSRRRKRIALVLAGGAARGAYEVGVVQYVLETVAKSVRREPRFDIMCGTSVGALNVCALAAWAHEGAAAVHRMIDVWQGLDVGALVRPDLTGLLSALRLRRGAVPPREGGIVDPTGIERTVRAAIPFERIDDNLARGLFDALSISTTHVQSGRSIVFMQTAANKVPVWSRDPTIEPRVVRIRAEHALASAAIPIIFRAVRIDGEFHCDGGLRQDEPLSPTRRLGADAVLVVNPRYGPTSALADGSASKEEEFPGPLFIVGKTLNALLLDRIDTDLARMQSINQILDAGTRAYGHAFVDRLNIALGHTPERGLRPMKAVVVRASQDIGKLATSFVRRHGDTMTGFAGRLMRRLAGSGPVATNESDLLSYLLFDGRFARELIDLGRSDARARHDELCNLFESLDR